MKNTRNSGSGTPLDQRAHQARHHAGLVEKDTKIYLRVVSGPDAGRVIDVSRGGNFVLGRGRVDIVLTDDRVSSRHAELKFYGPGQYYICDLASATGTYLNGNRVDRRKIGHEDELRLGTTVIRLSVVERRKLPLS